MRALHRTWFRKSIAKLEVIIKSLADKRRKLTLGAVAVHGSGLKEQAMYQRSQPDEDLRQIESTIVTAIRNGNWSLFHDLVQPYEKSVYKLALCVLQNESDAEDAAQEAFIAAFRNLSSFQIESRFGLWLVSIVLAELRNRLEKKNELPNPDQNLT